MGAVFLKFMILVIAFLFIYFSIKHPLVKYRPFEEPKWFKLISSIYILGLIGTFVVFSHTFSLYWGGVSTLFVIPFVVWALKSINLNPKESFSENEGIVDGYFIRYLFLCIVNERWNKVVKLSDNIINIIPEMEQNDRVWLLLIKSYAYIKAGKNEDAMDLLFSVLDYEDLDSSYKECIQFQFDLIEKSSMIA